MVVQVALYPCMQVCSSLKAGLQYDARSCVALISVNSSTATRKHNESVGFYEKLTSVNFKSRDTLMFDC
jgi:hypothetical protein